MGEIRLYAPGDGPALAGFFERYFPRDPKKPCLLSRSKEYYEWKYGSNPFGKPLGCCYWENRELLAIAGGIPVPLAIRGERVTGYLGTDAFVAPRLQDKRIFQKLETRLYEEFDPLSKIMYNLAPGALISAILQKRFNYVKTLSFRQAYSPLRIHEVLRAKGIGMFAFAGRFANLARELFARVPAIEAKEVGDFEPTLCPDVPSDCDFTVLRSPEYLEFRYQKCPEIYRYFHVDSEEWAAVLVVKLIGWRGADLCYLIDVIDRLPQQRSLRLLAAALCAVGRSTGSAAILLELPSHQLDSSMLRRFGFHIRRRDDAVIMRQTAWPFLNPSSPEYDGRRWIISSGDGDNF